MIFSTFCSVIFIILAILLKDNDLFVDDSIDKPVGFKKSLTIVTIA